MYTVQPFSTYCTSQFNTVIANLKTNRIIDVDVAIGFVTFGSYCDVAHCKCRYDDDDYDDHDKLFTVQDIYVSSIGDWLNEVLDGSSRVGAYPNYITSGTLCQCPYQLKRHRFFSIEFHRPPVDTFEAYNVNCYVVLNVNCISTVFVSL